MHYLHWNDLIAAHFFKPENAGIRVHLSVGSSVIDDLAASANTSRDDFVAAIKVGPEWVTRTRQGICQKALQAMEGWRERDLEYPPYVGYLAFFVLAAGLEGDFAPHAYYPRLRTLLDEPPTTGQYPSFERMLELWDDLERWANIDKQGELGQFQAEIAGGWINVGIPVAQVILSETERQRLHVIFAEAGLDPAATPSDEQMASVLAEHGYHRLRPRTLQILEEHSNANAEIRGLLISAALEELREWDGEFDSEDGEQVQINGTLRLCGRVDRIAQRVRFKIRCKSSHDIPDEGVVLSLAGVGGRLRFSDYLNGWSTELVHDGTGEAVDGATLDWGGGTSGRAEELEWRFRLPGAEVRIFEDGATASIPGIIEISRLQKDRPFYLACTSSVTDLIEEWGKSECAGFGDLGIRTGIPDGWKLYFSKGARSDALIRARFPSLAFNAAIRILFENGVRSSGSQYFTFGLPEISIDGDIGNCEVSCDGHQLIAGKDDRYTIPAEMRATGRLSIEVRSGEDILTRRSLFVSDEMSASARYECGADQFGRVFEGEDGRAFVSGAVGGSEVTTYEGFFLPVPPHRGRRIFIGRIPGQIISLGAGEHPEDWNPVWAIQMEGRRGSVAFCGKDLSDSHPEVNQNQPRRLLQDWKQILWYRRKRIEPPSNAALKKLWSEYQLEAQKL